MQTQKFITLVIWWFHTIIEIYKFAYSKHCFLLSDNEVQEAPDVNHGTEKHTEEGDLTVLQGLKKKGEKQRTKKSKQSFAQMKQEKVYDV